MKLANPLDYPLAVLVGAIAFVLGVRVAQLPSAAMLPAAAAIATVGAAVRRTQEPEVLELDNPVLERELQAVHQQAQLLVDKASALRAEATRVLTDLAEMELLGAVQYTCDRTSELPNKVDQLARRLHGADSLLSVDDLQRQLSDVETRLRSSTGVAREQLQKLADSLRRNIRLARQGQDTRQAQVLSLSTLISEAAGVLQELQNQLRTADLTSAEETLKLRSLSDEFKSYQENVDLLVSQ